MTTNDFTAPDAVSAFAWYAERIRQLEHSIRSEQMADIVVYHNGETHNMDWLRANYGRGIEVRRATAVAKFELRAISIMTSGETNLRIWVKGKDGGAKVGQPCTYSYPDPGAPNAELAFIPIQYKSRWAERGVLNKNQTGGDGKVDFQIGEGSWIRPESGRGPYTAWVLSPSIESDALVYTGWKMGTNHEGPVELFFAETSDLPNPEPEPEPEPGTGDLKETNALLRELIAAIKAGFRL